MRRRTAALTAAGVLALLGAGCNDDDGTPTDTTVEDGGIQDRELPTVEDRGS
jgi:hypothetical protein